MNLEKLKFPIGHFEAPAEYSDDIIKSWVRDIEEFPMQISKEVQHLSEEQLDTTYRPDGWTIRQVAHHCADSHMNSLMRFKLTLTEDTPTIRPYFEDKWAELVDTKKMDILPSLQMIQGIHTRWVKVLQSLSAVDLEKSFIHPEHGSKVTLKENIGIYAWHCRHHLAHITTLKKSKSWD